jgi:anti-sigma regulatory factor (Ser/Thr protein kinase)
MVCEVSDTGAGLRDPLAGHLPAGRSTARGRGLWLARQLCDLLEVHSDPAGTTVRLHRTLPNDKDGATCGQDETGYGAAAEHGP